MPKINRRVTICVSAEQIAALHAVMGDNARMLQPLNERIVAGPN